MHSFIIQYMHSSIGPYSICTPLLAHTVYALLYWPIQYMHSSIGPYSICTPLLAHTVYWAIQSTGPCSIYAHLYWPMMDTVYALLYWPIQSTGPYSIYAHLYWAIQYMHSSIRPYSLLGHTVYWAIQYICTPLLGHTVYALLYWAIQSTGPYSIYALLYWAIQSIGPYSLLGHTVYWAIQSTGPYIQPCLLRFISPCLQGTVMDLMVTQQSIWHTCGNLIFIHENHVNNIGPAVSLRDTTAVA